VKLELIYHRCNTISKLQKVDVKYGIEVDVRSNGQHLIIHHDAFSVGELFIDWIDAYRHGTLILNVKEEGLEHRLLDLMESINFKNFFFLDQSFPFIIKYSGIGERRCAIRISEYESIDTALTLSGKVDWVWVDCFTHFGFDEISAIKIKNAGFKTCLVSPELQGRDAEKNIYDMALKIEQQNIYPDAICTKYPNIWEKTAIIK
jgi:hypothetical protein